MDITKISQKRNPNLYKAYEAIQGVNPNFKLALTSVDRWNFEIALTLLSPYLEEGYDNLNERLKSIKIGEVPNDNTTLEYKEAFNYLKDENVLLIKQIPGFNNNVSLGSSIIDIASANPNEKSLLSAIYEGEKKLIAQLSLTNSKDYDEAIYYYDNEMKEAEEFANILDHDNPLLGHDLIKKSLITGKHDLIYSYLNEKGVSPLTTGKYLLATYNNLYNKSENSFKEVLDRRTLLKRSLNTNYLVSPDVRVRLQEEKQDFENLRNDFESAYAKSGNYDRALRYITEKNLKDLKDKQEEQKRNVV